MMQGKLGSLVLKIQNIVESAGIDVAKLKQLLILSYPFEEFIKEINRLKDFSEVFIAVRKRCSPVNIEVLKLIVDHFKLSDHALTVFEAYENEENNCLKRLLSTAFAKELQEEVELLGRNPPPECIIALKLKWISIELFTVKEFEKTVKKLFSSYSQFIDLCKVDEGCIFVTMYAPKQLMGALVKMIKTRLPYLLDIGVILLRIGDKTILDKTKKRGRYIHSYIFISIQVYAF